MKKGLYEVETLVEDWDFNDDLMIGAGLEWYKLDDALRNLDWNVTQISVWNSGEEWDDNLPPIRRFEYKKEILWKR